MAVARNRCRLDGASASVQMAYLDDDIGRAANRAARTFSIPLFNALRGWADVADIAALLTFALAAVRLHPTLNIQAVTDVMEEILQELGLVPPSGLTPPLRSLLDDALLQAPDSGAVQCALRAWFDEAHPP